MIGSPNIILGKLGQYGFWCPGNLCCQNISSHGIDTYDRQGFVFYKKEYNNCFYSSVMKWYQMEIQIYIYFLICI